MKPKKHEDILEALKVAEMEEGRIGLVEKFLEGEKNGEKD